jgi:hypothetical protein
MTIYLKQSTASQEVALGYFLDSTDGNTEETGLTIANTDIKLHKAGATTLANKNSGGATHISNGIYYAVLDATDTNTLGSLVIYCHPTGALATKVECVVLAANVYDSLIGGGDLLDVSTTQLAGQTVTAASGVTFPASLASPTNITAAAGCAVSSIGANVITATSIASNAITSAKIATDAIGASQIAANAIGASELASDAVTEIQTGLATSASIAALNNLSAAQVNAEVDTALADYDGPTNTEMVAAFTEIKGATWSTTDTLEAIRDRGDAAWTTATGFATATELAKVPKSDSNVTWNATALASINAEVDTAIGDASLATASALATVDGIVDDILVDTGTTIPATLAGLATSSEVGTVDTVVDAIKVKTDQLTFTKTNELDSNVQSINGAEIVGDGSGTPFNVA